jgi:hypothetical protein
MESDEREQMPRTPSATSVNARPELFEWCHRRAKQEIAEIVGKKIVGVVVKENSRSSPPRQVFLIFDDETSFEFYANCELTWTSGVHPGGIQWVRDYGSETYRIRFEHLELNQRPSASMSPFKKLLIGSARAAVAIISALFVALGTVWNLRPKRKRGHPVVTLRSTESGELHCTDSGPGSGTVGQ